jgi:methylthioribose-1-phosphate isomerase
MKVDGKPYRTIWPHVDGETVEVIDQTRLPHAFVTLRLASADEAARAIRTMQVRGAPLIGATAAYGLAMALRVASSMSQATRPTAVNLRWALDSVRAAVAPLAPAARAAAAFARSAAICDDDVAICRAIGGHGLALIRAAYEAGGRSRPVQIMTHCNAGWLATVDWGTATAPVYIAHDEGLPVHVWVDETRPRNQGAGLTAWELAGHGVPHTVIVDNAGGHVMQRGPVDLLITGTDRVAANGDVANKIGTYLKALAAADNGVPFYVALPGPTIDWTIRDGMRDIPIEERDASEVATVTGRAPDGTIAAVRVTPESSPAANFAFDVTPARLVTGLITERGLCAASRDGLLGLYPERRAEAHA